MEGNKGSSVADLIDWLNKNSDDGRAGDYVSDYTSAIVDDCIKRGIQDLEFKWELRKLNFENGEVGAYRLRIHSFQGGSEKAATSVVLFYSVFVNGKIGELFLKQRGGLYGVLGPAR